MPELNASMASNIPLREDVIETAAVWPLKFWTEHETVVHEAKDGKPERVEVVAHDWVHWAKKGVSIPQTNIDKVKRIRKDHAIWRALGPHYEMWQKGGELEAVPAGQTPLAAWVGVTRDEIEALRPYRIFSVEDFAGISEQVSSKVQIRDIFAKRDLAKRYLATRQTAKEVEAVLGDENAKLKKQLEDMQAQMTQLMAASQAALVEPKAKGKRVKEEAAA